MKSITHPLWFETNALRKQPTQLLFWALFPIKLMQKFFSSDSGQKLCSKVKKIYDWNNFQEEELELLSQPSGASDSELQLWFMKWMILHPHSHQRNLTDTQITLEKYEAFFPGGNESGLKANPSKLHFGFSLHAYLRLKEVLK